MKFLTGSYSWLLWTYQESFMNVTSNFHADMWPASVFTFTDTPFFYKLPIPTSDWVSFRWLITIHHSEVSLSLFANFVSWNHKQHCAFCTWDAMPFLLDNVRSITCSYCVTISVGYVPLKCWLIFSRLHSITSQKILLVLFMTSAMRTSDPTFVHFVHTDKLRRS